MNKAPARLRAAASEITLPRYHGSYKGRKKIETNVEIGDSVLIDGKVEAYVFNKGNCAASVELLNGDRTVVSLDRLTKKAPTSLADEEGTKRKLS